MDPTDPANPPPDGLAPALARALQRYRERHPASARQLERAEQLAAEVDPTVNYPEDWVIFRVTGYRPQMDAPAIVVGEALLGDISVLVERLSALVSDRALRERMTAYNLAHPPEQDWGRVVAATLAEYRRAGAR